MIDIESIKNKINEDDIISIMENLGVPFVKQDNKQIIFYSICHHLVDFEDHKPKLYYYINSKKFNCFVCGFNGDIFSLVQHIKSYSFVQAVSYVCKNCHIDLNENKATQIDQWRSMKKFLPVYVQDKSTIQIYDNKVLDLFNKFYPKNWIEEGISKEAMDKFHIGWYGRNEQITLPVFDISGNLIGIHARNTRQYLVDKGLKYQPLKTLNCEYKFPTSEVLYGLYENQDIIKSTKAAILFEGPKSVLQMESILEQNNSLALFGLNCQRSKRDMLLDLGIKKIYIALDKQYREVKSLEFDIYKSYVSKIIKLFKPYCQVYIIWDRKNFLDYKDSPSDKGKEIWDNLYQQKTKI